MRLVTLIVLLVVLCTASSEAWLFKDNEYVQMFQSFITKFKRAYSTSAFAKKLLAFKANVDKITAANKKKLSFALGVTEFADLTTSEFKAKYLTGVRAPTSGVALIEAEAEGETYADMSQEELNQVFNDGFDWSSKNLLLAPRHQGDCGSCWAFAMASTLEGAVGLAGGKKQYLGVQPAVSCGGQSGCGGCSGGFATCAFKFARDCGYFKESDAPYKEKETACMSKKLTPLGKIKEHKKIEGTTAAYTTAVQKNPLWVALDAAPLQLYRSGILSQDSNCTIEVTHAVVMVGYGTDKGVQFLNIRNSWGPTWGEKGHFRIAASGIACGMYKWGAYYPVLA